MKVYTNLQFTLPFQGNSVFRCTHSALRVMNYLGKKLIIDDICKNVQIDSTLAKRIVLIKINENITFSDFRTKVKKIGYKNLDVDTILSLRFLMWDQKKLTSLYAANFTYGLRRSGFYVLKLCNIFENSGPEVDADFYFDRDEVPIGSVFIFYK